MSFNTITFSIKELDTRIKYATIALSRKNFTEKQLQKYLLFGIKPSLKNIKSGYQLFIDSFRNSLSDKDKYNNTHFIAKKSSILWNKMSHKQKLYFIDKANSINFIDLSRKNLTEKQLEKYLLF